ncbi:MAG: hypothetical protein PHD76_02465 [Methylacidiphilales bacterium]|nr:hypothetical protein [Candidatus Methylacidiphilales bacterium]
MNLNIIRFLTAFFIFVVLFIPTFCVLYLFGCAIAGGIAGMHHPANSYQAGADAAKYFVKTFGLVLFIISLLFSILVAYFASFSNILPWCRKEK